jgi:hypothetical protein
LRSHPHARWSAPAERLLFRTNVCRNSAPVEARVEGIDAGADQDETGPPMVSEVRIRLPRFPSQRAPSPTTQQIPALAEMPCDGDHRWATMAPTPEARCVVKILRKVSGETERVGVPDRPRSRTDLRTMGTVFAVDEKCNVHQQCLEAPIRSGVNAYRGADVGKGKAV